MEVIYTEINVNVIVNPAIILRENYSSDANVKNVRDRIEFVDEYLETKSKRIISESTNTCTDRQQKHKHVLLKQLGLQRSVQPKNKETTNLASLTQMNKHQEDQSTLQISNVTSMEIKTKKEVKDIFQSETQENKNGGKSMNKVEHEKSAMDDRQSSKTPSQSNVVNLSINCSSCEYVTNEAADFDEASSGIFSGDENELDDEILERTKRVKSIDQLSSPRHDNQTGDDEDIHSKNNNNEAFASIPNKLSLVVDLQRGIKTKLTSINCDHKYGFSEITENMIDKTCYELMNYILDRLEMEDNGSKAVCHDKPNINSTNTCCNCTTMIKAYHKLKSQHAECNDHDKTDRITLTNLCQKCLGMNSETQQNRSYEIMPLFIMHDKDHKHTLTNTKCSCIAAKIKCKGTSSLSNCKNMVSQNIYKSSKFYQHHDIDTLENQELSKINTQEKITGVKIDSPHPNEPSSDELEPGEIPDEVEIPEKECFPNTRKRRTSPRNRRNYVDYRHNSSRTKYTRYTSRYCTRKAFPSDIISNRNTCGGLYKMKQSKPSEIHGETTHPCDLRSRIEDSERRFDNFYPTIRLTPPYRRESQIITPRRKSYESVDDYIRKYRVHESRYLSCYQPPVLYTRPRYQDYEFEAIDSRDGERGRCYELNKYKTDSLEKRDKSGQTSKYRNFKITCRFSSTATNLKDYTTHNKYKEELEHSSKSYKLHSESSDNSRGTNEKNKSEDNNRYTSGERLLSERRKTLLREDRRKYSSERDRKSSKELVGHSSKNLKRSKAYELERKSSRADTKKPSMDGNITARSEKIKRRSSEKELTMLTNKKERKISSVVTVATANTTESSENSSSTTDTAGQDQTTEEATSIKKDAHMKCFDRIRDLAFKKAVHYSDDNWNKYAKRKFLFEDELVQQLERSFNRYLYSVNELTQKGNGPLPRFVSDELMTEAIISTWKEPQIVASLDRQFREFDEIIGYVGYNIPCYWCEMIFAEGKFVRAFPVLDPIGHRDDTMYCQTDD